MGQTGYYTGDVRRTISIYCTPEGLVDLGVYPETYTLGHFNYYFGTLTMYLVHGG